MSVIAATVAQCAGAKVTPEDFSLEAPDSSAEKADPEEIAKQLAAVMGVPLVVQKP